MLSFPPLMYYVYIPLLKLSMPCRAAIYLLKIPTLAHFNCIFVVELISVLLRYCVYIPLLDVSAPCRAAKYLLKILRIP